MRKVSLGFPWWAMLRLGLAALGLAVLLGWISAIKWASVPAWAQDASAPAPELHLVGPMLPGAEPTPPTDAVSLPPCEPPADVGPWVLHLDAGTPGPSAESVRAPRRLAPKRILLVGECNIEGGLGPLLEQHLEHYPGVQVKRWGQRSTGLARPDYFDWLQKLRELKAEFQPDLIVGYWGDNDCQNQTNRRGKCVATWGSEQWPQAYGASVNEVVGVMREGGCAAVVVGMPAMRGQDFRERIARVNSVLEQATLAAGGYFIPTWDITTDAQGNFLDQAEHAGKRRSIRAKDGIHFTSHGAAYMADEIRRKLTELFIFTEPAA